MVRYTDICNAHAFFCNHPNYLVGAHFAFLFGKIRPVLRGAFKDARVGHDVASNKKHLKALPSTMYVLARVYHQLFI